MFVANIYSIIHSNRNIHSKIYTALDHWSLILFKLTANSLHSEMAILFKAILLMTNHILLSIAENALFM